MKKIRRWKGGMDPVQAAQYLHDMAAEGWILDEVGYLQYVFREEEPQELTYRVVTMKEAATGEELAQYEADGWQKVGNWEQEYVFVKERDIWTEDVIDRQTVVEEIDRKLEKEKKDNRISAILFVMLVCIFLLVYRSTVDTGVMTQDFWLKAVVELGPNFLLIFGGGWLATRRLRKKKERMLEGDAIPERDTDWRWKKLRNIAVIWILILLFGMVIYYEMRWNEKIYTLPQEIAYAEVPAVRLENLEDVELVRTTDTVEKQKEQAKEIYSTAFLQWHTYENSVTETGQLIGKKIETNQWMRPVDSQDKIELTTEYHGFVLELLAQMQYKDDLDFENEAFEGDHNGGMRAVKEISDDAFDELHVCQKTYQDETITHILCRQGKQVMELNYMGQAEPERILKEVEKVFEAQN